MVSTIRSSFFAGCHCLCFDREQILTSLQTCIIESTFGNTYTRSSVGTKTITGLDTCRSYIAVISRTLQVSVIGREAPAAPLKQPGVTSHHVVPVHITPCSPVGQIAGSCDTIDCCTDSITCHAVKILTVHDIKLINQLRDLSTVFRIVSYHILNNAEPVKQFIGTVSELRLRQQLLHIGNITVGDTGIVNLHSLVNLEVRKHDIGSHVIGTEHQITFCIQLSSDNHLCPFSHERSCSCYSCRNGLVAFGVEEEVHVVRASGSYRAVNHRRRFHPIRNGIETCR